ncbi:MAG: sporulation protein YabP [Oscillospiraceae bacterium]|nr:sporulation protein YabP [Oscillospiraceae bacterium]
MDNLQFPHKLTLNERSKLTLSGVTEVVSFDDTAVSLHTAMGDLEIQGQELKLKSLSPESGQLEVTGHICALFYEEPRSAGGFWSRLRR